MSSASHHLPGVEQFDSARAAGFSKLLLILAILALGLTAVGGYFEPKQFAFSWLFAFFFYYTITLGCLFWTLVHHAVDADWSVVVRRQLENVAALGPWLLLLFLPLLLVAPILYHWMNPEIVAHDPVYPDKVGYLNHTFFYFRIAVYFGFLIFAGWIYRSYSCRQDVTGSPVYTYRMRCMAYGFIPLFAVTVSFSAIDWLMGLDYHWYSTMWGVYIFAGTAQSSMATIILIAMTLQGLGYYHGALTREHFHIMGKLLFAFTVFWAYIAFSQYMLIWYANIPEETTFFLERNVGSWWWASVFLVAGHFVLPFILLLTQGGKKNLGRLRISAVWVLFMHAFDHHWIVTPKAHPDGFAVHWLSVTSWVGIGALLAFFYLRKLGAAPLFPVRDPRLKDCVELTN
jgi:hypothetical protein